MYNHLGLYLEQYGVRGLMLLTFLESFAITIPPEFLFIPLALVEPGQALWLALITICISIPGAAAGHCLGARGGRPLMNRLFGPGKVQRAEAIMQRYGMTAVLIASFFPIPYKAVTLPSGVLKLPLKKFLFWSTLGRSARFLTEGAVIMTLGRGAGEFMERSAHALPAMLAGVIGLAAYFSYVFYRHRRL